MSLKDPTKDNFLEEIQNRIDKYKTAIKEAQDDDESFCLTETCLKCEAALEELKSLKQYIMVFFKEDSTKRTTGDIVARVKAVRKVFPNRSLYEITQTLYVCDQNVDKAIDTLKKLEGQNDQE